MTGMMAFGNDVLWPRLKAGIVDTRLSLRKDDSSEATGRRFTDHDSKAVPQSSTSSAGREPVKRVAEKGIEQEPEPVQDVRFDGRVAIITGAGHGLGRMYALELARRGAKVVVNDLGGSTDGTGESHSAADAVVAEVLAAGGEAVASYDSVTTVQGGERIVQTAIEHFGKLDILINNAGIIRDRGFVKMIPEDWEAVLAVHLQGAYNVTRPAFTAMRQNGYGRIVMVTSSAGLFGNAGQTNYCTAKMGLVGLMNALKLEGEKYNIKVNAVAPTAVTRLSEDFVPSDFVDKLRPDYVAPLVAYLVSDQCNDTGLIMNAGMGLYGRTAVVSSPGIRIADDDNVPMVEDIQRKWSQIKSLEGAQEHVSLSAANMAMMIPVPDPRRSTRGEKHS